MEKDKAHWTNDTMPLEAVTIFKIVEEQRKINTSGNMFVVATEREKRWTHIITEQGAVSVLEKDKEGHILYDVLIYYKVKPDLSEAKKEADKRFNVKPIEKPAIDKNIF